MSLGFPLTLVESVVCQSDGGVLTPEGTAEAYMVNGVLVCECCATRYPIRNGILHTMESQKRLSDSEVREQHERNKEASTYDARLHIRHHKEVVPMMSRLSKNIPDARVIEYAAGTGRFTIPIAAQAREVLAVDFSLTSLAILQKKLPSGSAVGLVYANAANFRTAPHAFNVAVAAQFIEHIAQEKRSMFYHMVANALTPGGVFIASVYHHDLRRRLQGRKQTGSHPSGVPYHYFTRGEMSRELMDSFAYRKIRPFDITLPLEERLHLPPKVKGSISRVCEYVPGLALFGHLLYVEAYTA